MNKIITNCASYLVTWFWQRRELTTGRIFFQRVSKVTLSPSKSGYPDILNHVSNKMLSMLVLVLECVTWWQ